MSSTFADVEYSNLRSPGWVGARVGVADTFLDRLAGMKAPDGRDGVILRARSVHTLGMKQPIGVFATNHAGTVIAVRIVPPNRVAVFRGAEHLVELPAGRPLPVVGSHIASNHE